VRKQELGEVLAQSGSSLMQFWGNFLLSQEIQDGFLSNPNHTFTHYSYHASPPNP